jgi:hypothetical protein
MYKRIVLELNRKFAKGLFVNINIQVYLIWNKGEWIQTKLKCRHNIIVKPLKGTELSEGLSMYV